MLSSGGDGSSIKYTSRSSIQIKTSDTERMSVNDGSVNISTALSVAGATTLSSNTSIAGALSTLGAITSTGDISGTTNLAVAGTSKLCGNSTLSGTLTTVGIISGTSGLEIAGTAKVGGNVTMTGTLTTVGDIKVGGGLVRNYTFYRNNLLQGGANSDSIALTASVLSSSEPGGTQVVYTKYPLATTGSVIALSVCSQDGTVKSGSLTGTIYLNGSPTLARVFMTTGSVFAATWSKDTYTFNGPGTLSVFITSSATYLNDIDITSCSFVATVDVEY